VNRKKKQQAEDALEEYQLRFESTFESAEIGLAHCSPEGDVLLANQFLCNLLGYTQDEIKTLNFESIVHHEDLSNAVDGLQLVVKRKERSSIGDRRYIRKDGSLVWVHSRVSLVTTKENKAAYFVVAVEDLTERRATEAQLLQAQKMEVVGQLTGGIAHDFNNLLTVIIGGIDVALLDSQITEANRQVLENVQKSAQNGADLNQRLLAFSRRQALLPEEIQVRNLLEDMEQLLRGTMGETVKLKFYFKEEEIFCHVDRPQLESAILNLAINARDAMPQGGEIKIKLALLDLDSDQAEPYELSAGLFAEILVIDSGVGMTNEVLSKAIEPFFTTKETGKGSGLGLSMVYGFAKQSGGALVLDSPESKGLIARNYYPQSPRPNLPKSPQRAMHLQRWMRNTVQKSEGKYF